MCGIAGGIDTAVSLDAALDTALAQITHRGPDDAGTWNGQGVSLGAARLAVIDLAGGHQPMTSEDGRLTVVFNGEIYNYREIRARLARRGCTFRTDCDTEVLVHLYDERGANLVDDLRGMFAFTIYDRRHRRLLLARDRFGKKPLYYQRPKSGGFVFGSELKALEPLSRACGEKWTIRAQSVSDYLSLGVVPQPDTVFEGVHSLEAGSTLTLEDDRLSIRSYWEPTFAPKLNITYKDAQLRLREKIRESVNLRLRSDVPLGVFLSGGVDSSVVAYEASKQLGPELRTFTVATGGELDESAVAERTANALGATHTVLKLRVDPVAGLLDIVQNYDQPFADSSAIATTEISRLARQHVKVVLNGDGGDEVFAGYRRHLAAHIAGRFDRFPTALTRNASALFGRATAVRRGPVGFLARFTRGLSLDPAERYLAWTTDMLRESDKSSVWLAQTARPTEEMIATHIGPELSGLDRQVAADVDINLLSDLLVKMDIATMVNSLEARSPLLDHELAEFAWRLPDSFRVRRGVPKAILRDAYQGRLSDEVVRGAKKGFEVPMAEWLRGPLKPLLMDTLGSSSSRTRAYVDGRFIDALLEGRAMPERNWGYLVYSFLVLELWLDERSGRC